ncbi:MAG TPA: hypothetical protein VFA78_03150 [Chloroflexota bacterium]|nr:hypothetical protein [Chloroflexota bacterium]
MTVAVGRLQITVALKPLETYEDLSEQERGVDRSFHDARERERWERELDRDRWLRWSARWPW